MWNGEDQALCLCMYGTRLSDIIGRLKQSDHVTAFVVGDFFVSSVRSTSSGSDERLECQGLHKRCEIITFPA